MGMKLTSGFKAVAAVGALSMVLLTNSFAKAADPFVGDWALTIPGGAAGWLGVEEAGGKPTAQIMWGVGSVLPVDEVEKQNDVLVLTRVAPRSSRPSPPRSKAMR